MANWQTFLKADPTEWLLEENQPSIRCTTLKEVLDRPTRDPKVLEAQAKIMCSGPVPVLLSRQHPGGYWGKAEDFYIRSKFRGTVWTLILLAELGADGGDPRLQSAADFILTYSQDRQSKGFSYQAAGMDGGDHEGVIPCLTGNMLYCLVRLGKLADPRVQGAIQWVLRYQRTDDKDHPAPVGWPYSLRYRCWGRHTCHMGVVKTLKALAEIPPDQRSLEAEEFIRIAAEYLLAHHIYRRSHDLEKIAMPRWLEFGFPRFYDTDALEILWILTRLGYRDERMQEAVDLVASKQDEHGHWMLEHGWSNRTLVTLEKEGQASKWLTLRALTVLKGFYG